MDYAVKKDLVQTKIAPTIERNRNVFRNLERSTTYMESSINRTMCSQPMEHEDAPKTSWNHVTFILPTEGKRQVRQRKTKTCLEHSNKKKLQSTEDEAKSS